MLTRFLALTLLLPATTAFAAPSFLEDEHVFIEVPFNDDVYAVGEKVTVQENIRGDALIAGRNLEILGNVQGDLTAVGGEILIEGTIGDDARVAGGEISITGTVTDDLIVAGGKVTIEEGSEVRGDVFVFGGELVLRGAVRGNVRVEGGNIGIDGPIGGTLTGKGENVRLNGSVKGTSTLVAERIVLGENAEFEEPVEYWTEGGQMDFGTSLKNTTATFKPELGEEFEDKAEALGIFAAFVAALSVFWILANGVVGLLYVWAAPKAFSVMAKKVMQEPGKQFLWGLLFFLLTPLALIVLFVTVIGIPLALFILSSYIFLI